MADEKPKAADSEGAERKDVGAADVSKVVGPPHSAHMRELAEDLPEKDEVQVAYKDALTADNAKAEAKAKAKAVEASPNADQTPSGAALLATAGISNDTERGEAYNAHKAALRHGYAPPEK